MRILFDVSHPAHVHLFKHAIRKLDDDGHDVRVVSRDKEVTTELLDAADIEHEALSTKGESPLGLIREWVGREARVIWTARRFDPDVIVSRLNPAAVHAARLTGAKSIVFHDTEAAGPLARLTLPLADAVCTPAGFTEEWSGQRRYAGYQELAYLHPTRFDPNPQNLTEAGVDVDEPYSVLRLVASDAHHDYGNDTFSTDGKAKLVELLARRGTVYTSVEGNGPIPDGAEPMPVPPEGLHDLLYHADCYVGDSNTTAAEAGILGTPALRYDTFGEGELHNFVELEEKYGLVHSTRDEQRLLDLTRSVVDHPKVAAARWREGRNRLLADKIDVTGYMLDLVELEGRR